MEEELEKQFRLELDELLKKHGAEIGLIQRGRTYMEYEVIQITIDSVYDSETSQEVSPCVEFDL